MLCRHSSVLRPPGRTDSVATAPRRTAAERLAVYHAAVKVLLLLLLVLVATDLPIDRHTARVARANPKNDHQTAKWAHTAAAANSLDQQPAHIYHT